MTDNDRSDIGKETTTAEVAGSREGLNTSDDGVAVAAGRLPCRCDRCGRPHSGVHWTASGRAYFLSVMFCRDCSLDGGAISGRRAAESEEAYDTGDDEYRAAVDASAAQYVEAGVLEARDE